MRVRPFLLIAAMVFGTVAFSPAPTSLDCTDLELPAGDPLPFGALVECPGIRPGAKMTSPHGCTFNFVFEGTSIDEEGNEVDEGLFIGTAGHCIWDGAEPDTVWGLHEGIPVHDTEGIIGHTVYGVDEGPLDFALIRILPERYDDVDPAMCHFGGPVAMRTNVPQRTVLHHFGQGLVYGQTMQARSGLSASYSDGGSVMNFASTGIFGDSGSGVIDDEGNAVGVLVRLGLPTQGGNTEATDLVFHVERAEQFTGIDFELVTAPMAP